MDEEMVLKIAAIAEHYGVEHQKRKLVEEMAELTKAILKPESYESIVEEIGDVWIMLFQMMYLLEVTDDELQKVMIKKVNRTLERNANEKSGECQWN